MICQSSKYTPTEFVLFVWCQLQSWQEKDSWTPSEEYVTPLVGALRSFTPRSYYSILLSLACSTAAKYCKCCLSYVNEINRMVWQIFVIGPSLVGFPLCLCTFKHFFDTNFQLVSIEGEVMSHAVDAFYVSLSVDLFRLLRWGYAAESVRSFETLLRMLTVSENQGLITSSKLRIA